jgi:hypothetical protein
VPLGRTGAGAGQAGGPSPLALRRRYYWSMRFSVWDATNYMANSTQRLKLALNDTRAQIYTNFNVRVTRSRSCMRIALSLTKVQLLVQNFAGREFCAGNGPASADPDYAEFGFDWFLWAKLGGASLLWTEDWCSDAEAHRWSFFASRMRSAIVLRGDPMEFGGYIVPRSGGDQEGGLIRRVLSLIGGGAKGFRYFTFGPEYSSPGNGYSDSPRLERYFGEMIQAHTMIAKAEDAMWEARRPAASIAFLVDRSSQFWDAWGELRPSALCLSGCTTSMVSRQADFFVESLGLFLALSTDGNVDVDWLDEEALEDAEVLKQYKVIVVTQPNVPEEGMAGLLSWATGTGGMVVTTSNAALWDRYNDPSSLLGSASGVRASPRARAAVTGQPPVAGTITANLSSSGAKLFNVTASGAHSTVEARSARVFGTFADGSPATVQAAIGSKGGAHLHFAWQPGLSYYFSDGGRDPNIRKMLRSLLVEQRSIEPLVTVNTSLVEAPLLIHPDQKRAVITLLNWTASAPTGQSNAVTNASGIWRKNSGTATHSIVAHSCGSKVGNAAWKAADGVLEFAVGGEGWLADDASGTEEWIVFDLGVSTPPVDGLALWASGDGVYDPHTLVLQKGSKPTGQDWEMVAEFTAKGGTKAMQAFAFAPLLSRFFRLEIVDRCSGTANPSHIAEIEFRDAVTTGEPRSPVELQLSGEFPFRATLATSATHGELEVRLNQSTGAATLAVPLLHGDVIVLEA